jgi:hypothetical protein
MKAYCGHCQKWTEVRFEPYAEYGRDELRGFALCCGNVVATKPAVIPPPICIHEPAPKPELILAIDRRSACLDLKAGGDHLP